MSKIRFNIAKTYKPSSRIYFNFLPFIIRVLYLLCLIIFLIDEISLNINHNYIKWHILFCCAEIIVFLIFTKWQIAGSWLIILTSWIGPILPFQTSAALIFSCLLAVTLLGYHNLLQGIGASLTYLITHTASTYIMQSAINTTDSLLMLMTLGVFCLAGSLLHWAQLKNETNNQLARSKYQQQVAISLHDRTCNNLTYAIRFIDERIYSNSQLSKTDLIELQDILRETLTQTRTTISQLINNDHSKDTQQADNSDQLKHLDQIISRAQHRLEQLQFRGEIINTLQDLNHLPKKNSELLFDVTNELFSDIIKHANPEQGYLVTFGTSGGNITIGACDAPRNDPTHITTDKPTTMGLLRYKTILEAQGGSISIQSTENLWMADITIPLISTFPIAPAKRNSHLDTCNDSAYNPTALFEPKHIN